MAAPNGRLAGRSRSAGSRVDERSERMGAGYALGEDPVPLLTFFASEAAGLLQLLQDVRERNGHRVNRLVFVDCLMLSDILKKWGRDDLYPEPKKGCAL